MNRKILVVSILAVFTLLTISFASAINTTTPVKKKETPLYRIRIRRAIGERLGRIIENIKTKFIGERLFFLPFQWLRNLDGLSVRMRPTWYTVLCIPTQCGEPTCEHSSYFHMFPEFGITELIGKNGKPIKKEGEIGEIVGTGFHSYIFPFIRYRTGDLGAYTTKKCPCRRNYPLLKRIEGRSQEFIVSKSKQLIPLTGVYGLVAKCSENVKECQLYQDKEGEILINIVKQKGYTKKDTNNIQKNFQKRFGDDFKISVRFLDHIPCTRTGKYRFLIQKLPIEFGS